MCSTFTPANPHLSRLLASLEGSPGRRPLPSLAQATLLVLDLQRLFVDPASPAYQRSWPEAAPGCDAVIAAFRAAGRPIIFTRHVNPEPDDAGVIAHIGGRPQRPDGPLAAQHPDRQPPPDEALIDKARYSPWWQTGLGELIPAGTPVVLVGVTTHRCVLTAAVEAASRDRLPVVVADATATHSSVLQLAALRCVAHGFGHVASAAEVIDAL